MSIDFAEMTLVTSASPVSAISVGRSQKKPPANELAN